MKHVNHGSEVMTQYVAFPHGGYMWSYDHVDQNTGHRLLADDEQCECGALGVGIILRPHEQMTVEERLALGFNQEWWSPGVLKPSLAMEYPEVGAWRDERIAEGARVMTEDEWRAAHAKPEGEE